MRTDKKWRGNIDMALVGVINKLSLIVKDESSFLILTFCRYTNVMPVVVGDLKI